MSRFSAAPKTSVRAPRDLAQTFGANRIIPIGVGMSS
jgi:hypothetical protein